jgi:hypothetical protein
VKHFFLVSLPFVAYSLLHFISQLLHGTTGTTQNHETWATIVIMAHLGWIAVGLLILTENKQLQVVLCKL